MTRLSATETCRSGRWWTLFCSRCRCFLEPETTRSAPVARRISLSIPHLSNTCYLGILQESFVLLDHILDDDTYPEYAALEHCEDICEWSPFSHLCLDMKLSEVKCCYSSLLDTRVANVCDVRGTDEVRAYRLNDDKLMQWLKQKVQLVPVQQFLVECCSDSMLGTRLTASLLSSKRAKFLRLPAPHSLQILLPPSRSQRTYS